MNTKLLLIALIAAGLSSCSTSNKFAQTPDDVYYSPVPVRNDYVQVNTQEEKNVYDNSSSEDREISRNINNRRWRRYHNYDYGYSYPYSPYGNYNPYGYNNYPVYINPKTGKSPSVYRGARKYNLGTYSKPQVTYTLDPKSGKIANAPAANNAPPRAFNKPQNGSGVGNLIRKVFTPSNSNTNIYRNNTTEVRSFESSSSSSSSSSTGSGSSNAPVRSFRK